MKEETTQSIRSVTHRMINVLDTMQKNKSANALLAALRNSVGKPLEQAEDIWPFLFENVPEEFLSLTGVPTKEETVIYTVLQLYAICMQGSNKNVIVDETFKGSIGSSLKAGRKVSEDSSALDRRFNVLIASDSFEELTYHLRQIIILVRSKAELTINFSGLANDLYWFQLGQAQSVCFKWATDYYSVNSQEQKND